jgi:hypothetical protein
MVTQRISTRRLVITSAVVIYVLVLGYAGSRPLRAQVQTYNCNAPGGFAGEAALPLVPPILLASLKTVENPVLPRDPATGALTVRADLAAYIANLPAAIQLGKALFWDMQVGSDNKTACASCHFNAGGDTRERNQLSPGPNALWDLTAYGPNSTLWQGGFPFTQNSFDTDNIAGSQGVRKSRFLSIDASGNELTEPVADATFNVGGRNVRQATGKNAPSIVNAVFNHRNFANGRAQPEFNGVNPFGSRDTSARIWTVNSLGGVTKMNVLIQNASLASQAVGSCCAGNHSDSNRSAPTTACSGRSPIRQRGWRPPTAR